MPMLILDQRAIILYEKGLAPHLIIIDKKKVDEAKTDTHPHVRGANLVSLCLLQVVRTNKQFNWPVFSRRLPAKIRSGAQKVSKCVIAW